MHLRRAVLPAVVGLILLAGCGSIPTGSVSSRFLPMELDTPPVDPDFQPGSAILCGFDQPCIGASWESNDWVLLGVKVSSGDESDVWFVRLSTLPNDSERDGRAGAPIREFSVPFGVGYVQTGAKFAAPAGRVLIEVYDRDGSFTRSTVRTIPQFAPRVTLLDVWRTMQTGPDLQGASLQTVESQLWAANSTAGLMTMMETVGSARSLRLIREAIRRDVIKPPSIIALLLAGLRLNLQTDIQAFQTQTAPWSPETPLVPRQLAHFPVSIEGQRLFDCRIVVGPPEPPYQLTAGVLLFEAVHPDKPQNRLSIRVLSAKRVDASMVP